jgi:ribosomal-protein-serine acetyltransferase
MDARAIRLYEPADAEDLCTAVRESVGEISPWMAWCHPEYTVDEAREWISAQAALVQQGLAYEFAIWNEGRYIGGCGINQINIANRFANVGYWIRASATGRGFAPAAVRQLVAFAFQKTNLVRLEIVCAVANVRSQRVAQKLGAVCEGRLRSRLLLPGGPSDALLFSLVRPTREAVEQ